VSVAGDRLQLWELKANRSWREVGEHVAAIADTISGFGFNYEIME